MQQGFRRRLLARLQAIAVKVGGQNVVKTELALVFAGDGQQRLLSAEARGIVAAGSRRPAATIEKTSGFDDLFGELFAFHACSSRNRVAMIRVAASATKLAMAKVQLGPRLFQL